MISVLCKNVGQGDSILLEWKENRTTHYGIIDCNIHENTNPLLEDIKLKNVKKLDFLILSHLHYDHYSGIADILEHCLTNKITINLFLHTFTTDFTRILDIIVKSIKVKVNTERLLELIDICQKNDTILEMDQVSHNFSPIKLFGSTTLSFKAPTGKDSFNLSKQRVAYDNGSTKIPDFNMMSTVIEITNSKESIILTSDATKKTLKRITGVIKTTAVLIQVPHHGSVYNLKIPFWRAIKKTHNCPAVFSVGDVKKDKLPNIEVVDYFENSGYYNTSTNFVYGLHEYYTGSPFVSKKKSTLSPISLFSKSKSSYSAPKSINNRFSGDQIFNIIL